MLGVIEKTIGCRIQITVRGWMDKVSGFILILDSSSKMERKLEFNLVIVEINTYLSRFLYSLLKLMLTKIEQATIKTP